MKKKTIFTIIITLFSLSLGIAGFDYVNDKIDTMEQQTRLQNELNVINQNALQKENEEKLESLQNENEEKLESLQNELTLAQIETEKLKNRKPETIIRERIISNENGIDIAKVSAEWQPRIVKVVCYFINHIQSGSGTVQHVNELNVYTNRHVITYNGFGPDHCEVILPNGETVFIANEFVRVPIKKPELDLGVLIAPKDSIKQFLGRLESCPEDDPKIGDPILILGYPTIGALKSITATEGIISGYDGEYYVTSAKIEQGNSGGAAIDIKRDCWLGIPSFGITGALESLSRILGVNAIFKSF